MRILVAEDDPPLGAFLCEALADEREEITLVGDGHSALDSLRNHAYDLILLDLTLPDMDGLEVLKQIRARELPIPVLILTGRGDVADRVHGLDLGADDYLTKPFSVQELRSRVRALLRRRSVQNRLVLQVEDLQLDRTARTVHRRGQAIELTQREFALLEFLMLNAGTPKSRREILEHVWHQEPLAMTNVVDVYINYLRKKVDDGFSRPLIRTQRGVGYCIGASPDSIGCGAEAS